MWEAGGVVEVAWTVQSNHGGGYLYRLCPLHDNDGNANLLNEACFQKTPLKFFGQQSFRWGGVGSGEQEFFDGKYVSTGTVPAGSTWAVNPMPNSPNGDNFNATGEGFPPKCKETTNCDPDCKSGWPCENHCRCSGRKGPYNLEIVDWVQIPADLPPGSYVLGWRWDCEESNQVWASCSDVTIKGSSA